MYYVSAFAYYRLNLLRVNGRLKIPHHRLYWHVLTAARRISAGLLPANSQSRKQQEKHCKKFLSRLWEPGEALILFEEAHKAIQKFAGQIDRDRLRRPGFTKEYLSKLKEMPNNQIQKPGADVEALC